MAALMDIGHRALLMVICLSCTFTSSKAISTLYVNDQCGATITLYAGNEFMLALSKDRTYWSDANCEMVIKTVAGYYLAFKFQEITLDDCGDMITLYELPFASSKVLYTHNCSNSFPVQDFTTPERGLLKFTSDALGNNGFFSIVITSFKNSSTNSCGTGYFRCTNKRCIKSELSCNSRDNCGDNSDEKDCKDDEDPASIWWIPFLAVVGFGVIAFVIYGIKLSCDNEAKRKAAEKAKKDRETSAQSTSEESDSSSQSSPPPTSGSSSGATVGDSGSTKEKRKKRTKPKAKPQSVASQAVSISTQTETLPNAPSLHEDVPPTDTTFQPNGNPRTLQSFSAVQPSAPSAVPIVAPILVHVLPGPPPYTSQSDHPAEPPPSYLAATSQQPPSTTARTDGVPPQNAIPMSQEGVYLVSLPAVASDDTQPPTYNPNQINNKQ